MPPSGDCPAVTTACTSSICHCNRGKHVGRHECEHGWVWKDEEK